MDNEIISTNFGFADRLKAIEDLNFKEDKMVLETERLILRGYRVEDIEALFEIFLAAETMQHYPKPYDKEMTKNYELLLI